MAVAARNRSIGSARSNSPRLTPEQRAKRREEGKAKAAAAIERLEAGIRQLLEEDESYREYLALSGKMHTYSARNRVLIWLQAPCAGIVYGFHRWKELGRPVKKGAKGIQILAPLTFKAENEETGEEETRVGGFKVAYVFSVHDTDGPTLTVPQPVPLEDDSEEARDIRASILARTEQLGVAVTFEDSDRLGDATDGKAAGFYDPREHRITVNANLPAGEQASTLVHELAHALTRDEKLDRREAEVVAESAAFCVCSCYGIDTSGFATPYIAHYAGDVRKVTALLDRVHEVVGEILADAGRCHSCGTSFDSEEIGAGCVSCC